MSPDSGAVHPFARVHRRGASSLSDTDCEANPWSWDEIEMNESRGVSIAGMMEKEQEERVSSTSSPDKSLPSPEPPSESDPKSRTSWDHDYEASHTTHTTRSASSSPPPDQTQHNAGAQNSPYPEVSYSVHSFDDPSTPVATIRACLLGVLFSIILPGINQFFFYRYPNIQIEGIIAQLLVHPLGLGLARLTGGLEGSAWFGWLYEGRWNAKEHTLVYIMANVSASSAYATNVIATQRFFYKENWGWAYQLLLVMTTQLLGFAFAGPLQSILVRPASMIWPSTLVNTALFNALHPVSTDGTSKKGSRSRQVFFYVNALGMFIWSWFPSYLFTALSTFDWVTWIKPSNQVVNLLFGYQQGAGMSLLTFDWGMIAAINNPLATPWWTIANMLGGFIFFIWFLAPVLYYCNVFQTKYLPFSSSSVFDNRASIYDLDRILGDDGSLFTKAYQGYSQIYMPITSVLSYGLSFAAVSATVVHILLFFRQQLWRQIKVAVTKLNRSSRGLRSRGSPKGGDTGPEVKGESEAEGTMPTQEDDRDTDVHATIMLAYPKVQGWWYLLLFTITFALSIVTIEVWPTELPVWGLLLALVIAALLIVPIGKIQAMTNHQVPLNVITELIIGYLLPGKPIAMLVFKTYGYISTTQALGLISDQKLAHYMHLPPRITFLSQLVGAIIGAATQLAVQEWLFTNIKGICRADQPYWWCPSTRTAFSSSILFGVLSPSRLFSLTSSSHLYAPLLIFFPLGAVTPILTYLLARRYPDSLWKYVCWPVVFSCISLLPPYRPINFVSFCIVGFIFQYYIRRKQWLWWSRYNFILSAAWSCGYAICVIVIFFTLQLPRGGQIAQAVQNWWGNTVYLNTLDGKGDAAAAALHLQSGETFGPAQGSWS